MSPCGKYLAAHTSGTIIVYNLLTHEALVDLSDINDYKCTVQFWKHAPLVSVFYANQTRIWNLSTGNSLQPYSATESTYLDIPKQAQSFLVSSDQDTITGWDLKPQLSWQHYALITALHNYLENRKEPLSLPQELLALFNTLPEKYKSTLARAFEL